METQSKKQFITEVGTTTELYTWNENALPISEIIELIKEAQEAGATHIGWSGSSSYDSEDVYNIEFRPLHIRTETDEEFSARLHKEYAEMERQAKLKMQLQEDAERATFERLKKKYEANV